MKKNLVLLMVFAALVSCKKDTSCNVNSIDQLPWAVDFLSGNGSCIIYDNAKFYSYTFKGKQVFYFSNPLSSNSNCGSIVFDCSGNRLSYDQKVWDDFNKKRRNGKLLWEMK